MEITKEQDEELELVMKAFDEFIHSFEDMKDEPEPCMQGGIMRELLLMFTAGWRACKENKSINK